MSDAPYFSLDFQIEYKLNSVQLKFLRLLSRSAFQEMNYSCTESSSAQTGCMVDLKGENEVALNDLDKVNLDVTEVGSSWTLRKMRV